MSNLNLHLKSQVTFPVTRISASERCEVELESKHPALAQIEELALSSGRTNTIENLIRVHLRTWHSSIGLHVVMPTQELGSLHCRIIAREEDR